MKTNFNDDNFDNDLNTSFEFSSDFESDESIPSLVDEFNAQEDVNFDNTQINFIDDGGNQSSIIDKFDEEYNDYVENSDNILYNVENESVDDNLFNEVDKTSEPFDVDLLNNDDSIDMSDNDNEENLIDTDIIFNSDDISLNDNVFNDDVNEVPIDFNELEKISQNDDDLLFNNDDEGINIEIKEQSSDDLKQENTKEDPIDDFENRINELEAGTDFTIDNNENLSTDINNLFVKVNNNVQEASDIFLRNVEMKKILDNRFEELKKLQSDIEKTKKADYEEINNYKEEVIAKLTVKKEEVEEKLNLLKDLQVKFEKEKSDFENYKKEETIRLDKLKQEEEASFEIRKNELNRIEDKLRKQKDFLEEERRNLSLDQIQYETDKNELANNMIKFNDIVSKFTNGIDKIN